MKPSVEPSHFPDGCPFHHPSEVPPKINPVWSLALAEFQEWAQISRARRAQRARAAAGAGLLTATVELFGGEVITTEQK